MRLDIFADVICPWCWIGKRRLEQALKARPQEGVVTRWRAFQLNPGMPPSGMDRREYLAAKFGGDGQALRIYEVIRTAGESEGLEFNFGAIQRTPNTLRAHRLVRLAQERGKGNAMMEALFRAYFTRGEDIGDREVLVDAAVPLGLTADDVRRQVDSAEGLEAVQAEDALARRHGINGVPCYIFNGKFALAGAHEPEVLFQLFDLARVDEASAGAEAGA
ncbi:MAG TPA: DsbA family oxidoreductase [Alphaproteobacteria bacterium]|nr:DsbA family oxidoreductase [Alphaproteobacteria bacterium]